MTAAQAAFCTGCGKPLAADVAFCTACGTKRAVITAKSELCPQCGAAIAADAAFCTKCGAPKSAPRAAAAAAGAAAAPAPAATEGGGDLAGLPAMAGAAAGAFGTVSALAGGAVALPWQTIVSGQPVDAAGLARAAAPSLLAMAPRPNLRWPAAGIAVTVVMDVVISLVSGSAVNVPMLGMRVLSGLGTSLFGMLAGKGGGVLRKVTGATSVVYGVVQLVSLVTAAIGALSNPAGLLVLAPSIVAVISGLVLSVSTAIAGFRR